MRAAEDVRSFARPATFAGLAVAVVAAFLILITHARSQPTAEPYRIGATHPAAARASVGDPAEDLNAEMEARLAADVKRQR